MDIIIEPKGVNFVIQSPPLSKEEKIEISKYIEKNRELIKKSKKTTKVKIIAKSKT